MAHYKMIVQLDPTEGHEAEFLDYYPHVHIRDVTQMAEVKKAEFLRRRLTVSDPGDFAWEYMVIYEIECDDPEAFLARLMDAMKAGKIRANFDLLRPERRTCFYEPVGDPAGGGALG